MNINIIDFLTNIYKNNNNNNKNEINIEQNQSLVSSLFLLIPNLKKDQILNDLSTYLKNDENSNSEDTRFKTFLLSIIYNTLKYNYNEKQQQNENEQKVINEILEFFINKFIIVGSSCNSSEPLLIENEIKNITNLISNIQNLIFSKSIYSTCCNLINGITNLDTISNKYGFFIVNGILNNCEVGGGGNGNEWMISKMSQEFYPTLIPVIIENLKNSTIINQYAKQQSLLILSKILLDKSNVDNNIISNESLKTMYYQDWLKQLWFAITCQKDINERLKYCFFFHQCWFDCLLYNLKNKKSNVQDSFNVLERKEYWSILFDSLIDKDSLPRKQASHLLKNTVSLPSVLWKNWLPKTWEQKQWNLFFSLYDCFDETKSHLFVPVWVQIHNLTGGNNSTINTDNFLKYQESTSIYFWIRVLYFRGFNHMNVNIRKRVILDALADTLIVPHLIEIEFEEFQQQLLKSMDVYELSNNFELGRNKELVDRLIKFFSHVIKTTGQLETILKFTSSKIVEIKTIILFISTLSPLITKLKLKPSSIILDSIRLILNTWPIQNDNQHLYQQIANLIISFNIESIETISNSFTQISKILSILPKSMMNTEIKKWINLKNDWFLENLKTITNNSFNNNDDDDESQSSYQVEIENLQGLARILSICSNVEILNFIDNTIVPLLMKQQGTNKLNLLLLINCIFDELNGQDNQILIGKLVMVKDILIELVKEYINGNNSEQQSTILSKEDSEKVIDKFKKFEAIIKIIKKFNNQEFNSFHNEIQQLILNNQQQGTLDLKGITIVLLVWIQPNYSSSDNNSENDQLISKLLELEPKFKFDSTISFILPKFIQFKWTCIFTILSRNNGTIKYDQEKTFKLALSELDNATGLSLIPIFECISIVISSDNGNNEIVNNEEYMNQLFKQAYLSFSDSNRKPTNLVVAFINLLFNSVLFENEITIPLIKQYLKQTLSDWGESVRISCGLLSHCCSIWSKKLNTLPIFLNEIIDLCCLTSEDQIELEDDNNNNDGEFKLFNNHGYIIRCFVSQLNVEECKPFVSSLLLELLELNFKSEAISKREYSQQSRTNKIKCKLWRTLCSLTHIIVFTDELYSRVSELMWKTLELKNHGNIRYLIQLFIVNVLIKSPNLQITNQQLINKMENAINSDYQISASLIIISSTFLYYLLNNYQPNHQELVINLFKTILPWSTDFHHAVRTTCQLAIYSIINKKFKVLEQFNDNQFIISLYNYLDTHKIQKRLREKQTLFIQNDDPLKKSLPDNIFTSSTSYFDNQDDSNEDENGTTTTSKKDNQDDNQDDDNSNLSVLDDSIIPMSLLDISKRLIKDFQVSFQNNQIQHSVVPTSTLKSVDEDVVESNSTPQEISNSDHVEDNDDILDFQRRITPWQWVNKLEEHHQITNNNNNNNNGGGNSGNSKNNKKQSRQSIIVCATFIENTPNIAGLIRTCEIFNVEQVAIPNNKLLSDPQFQRVSVSAEKLVPTIEITKPNLRDYLKLKKKQGYSILGVEQTSQSKKLSEFQFPEKCLLLLGQEQNGIPAEYLSIIDYCIEIEQLGQVRSLNVHVCGSIVVWEYTKQQLLKQKQ